MQDPRQLYTEMPDFDQPKIAPYATINIRVADEAALRDLEQRLGQALTPKTKSLWHPERPTSIVGSLRWT